MSDGFDVHDALRDTRLQLADYLDRLEPAAWSQPSLCDGWSIADVAAHLSLSGTETWPDLIVGMIKNRGNWDRWNARQARAQAGSHAPAELVAIIRRDADSTAHAPGSSAEDQLVDFLVHGQDISRAIHAPLPVPAAPGVAALEQALGSRWYGARKRLDGVRLVATDADWAAGNGAEIRGPLASLLLVTTGRPAGVDELQGPAVAQVKARLA